VATPGKLPGKLNATNYIHKIIHPRPKSPNIAIDIVAIATVLISEEVVFYFLPRNLENEERESRRKKVKDTPQSIPSTANSPH